jgi:hypothetical protein
VLGGQDVQMNEELSMVSSFRRVLEEIGRGRGTSQALVRELKEAHGEGRNIARKTLLGSPFWEALGPSEAGLSPELTMLASLIATAGRGSSRLMGIRGGELTDTVERWVRAKETDRMEDKVMRFRALVASAVMGAVVATVAGVGPIVSGLNLESGSLSAGSPLLLPAAGLVSVVSSTMLGLYVSGRGFLMNSLITLATFTIVVALVGPLASAGTSAALAIK